MKKVLFAVTISAGLILAACQAMAAAYAPGNAPVPATIQQGTTQGASGNRIYVSGMPNGAQYQMVSTQPGSAMMAYGYSRQAAWWALLVILTVVLVWANLLLLIALQWHILNKHKKNS